MAEEDEMDTTAYLTFREGPQCSAGRYGVDVGCRSPSGTHVALNVDSIWIEGDACLHHARAMVHELALRTETLIVELGMLEALGIVVPPANIKIAAQPATTA